MAEIRGGWRRRHRRGRSKRLHTDYGGDTYEGYSLSSDNDVTAHGRRDPALDDAFFGFFMKQSINSLKRNFSDFCQDTIGPSVVKKSKPDGVDKSAFSRYGCKYFMHILKKLTPQQRAIIEKFGFRCLLLFDCCHISSDFCRWVADCIDPHCSLMTVCGKSIKISKETFHVILGLPIGGLQILLDCDDGKAFILSHFNLSEIPHVTFFGNKLSCSDPLSELDVFVCFMAVAMSCFLCPDISESISWKYLSILKDPAAARGYDFSQIVYAHCLNSIREFISFGNLKGRRMKAPVGCNYVPVVRYLDCLDFGTMNVAPSHPRVLVWRGNMINTFSDLDRKGGRQFGKKQLKETWPTVQNLNGLSASNAASNAIGVPRLSPIVSPLSVDFRNKARDQYVSSLQPEVVDGILSLGDKFLSTKSASSKRKLEVLVSSVLDFLCKTTHTNGRASVNLRVNEESNRNQKMTTPSVLIPATTPRVESEIFQQKSTPTLQGAAKLAASTSYRSPEPVTPSDCLITKVVEGRTHSTAPVMVPLKKVKARNCNTVSAQDAENLFNNNSCPAKSKGHIPLIDLPESPSVKPASEGFKLNRVNASKKLGSKQVPILITDVPPDPSFDVNDEGIRTVGSNELQKRSAELSKKADTIYNNMMVPKQNGVKVVSSFQHNAPDAQGEGTSKNAQDVPRTKLYPKYKFVNWLVTGQNPPLQSNERFPVSEEDIINYTAIIELAHSPIRKNAGVDYPKIHCSYQSLGLSFMPNGEVDNFIIPCFCRLLFEERHPNKSGRHYFFPHIGDAILKYAGANQEVTVRKAFEGATKASKGRNLGHRDNTLLFPIVNNGHWFGFAVDFEYKVFAFLDSLFDQNSPFHLATKNRLIDNFIHLWEVIISENHNFGEFEALYPDVPKQNPGSKDCGVFVMKFMETWKPNVDTRTIFSRRDILNLRILYANMIYFHNQNNTDTSLVTDFYAAG